MAAVNIAQEQERKKWVCNYFFGLYNENFGPFWGEIGFFFFFVEVCSSSSPSIFSI